jgi:staphylococcal nuclease domain-containing protein 1
MQRDVEFEVDSIDKSGGFIGSLYLNKSENVAISLVKEGLATVHSFSADSLSWARQLYEAEVNGFIVYAISWSNTKSTCTVGSKAGQTECWSFM